MRREDSESGDMIVAYTNEVNTHKREELLHLKKGIITKTGGYRNLAWKKKQKMPSNYKRN